MSKVRARTLITPRGRYAVTVESVVGRRRIRGVGVVAGIGAIGKGGKFKAKLRSIANKLAHSKALMAFAHIAKQAASTMTGGAAGKALDMAKKAARAARVVREQARQALHAVPAPVLARVQEAARSVPTARPRQDARVVPPRGAAPVVDTEVEDDSEEEGED